VTTHLLRERYETLDVVGRGGEGEVHRALDRVHDRYVALKVRPISDEASRTELLTEARLLLSLTPHPGLPLVREDFFAGERYVIAMDWIDGSDLESVLEREGRPGLDPEVVIDYLGQAADALEHLRTHVPPVVHGDVKPANLIVASDGRVVLVDFGLSSMPADDLRRAGTAGYVAPEVAAGARPTAASDVYSFAATALRLLTGSAPGDSVLDWGAIEPARVSALERVLRPNLATDPARRDVSASALVARLRRWWGAELPTGTVTLLVVDPSPRPTREAEDALDEIARAHGGHVVSSVDDGLLLVAFGSAHEGLDAARGIAVRDGSAVAVVTDEMQPLAGTYEGSSVSAAHRLLAFAGREYVLLDERTAAAVDEQLPRDLALAQAPDAPTGEQAWALVAPDLPLPPRAGACPYRGLLAFEPADGDLFFGREELIAAMLDDVRKSGFLAVVGPSGSGKSSLVRAGLVPALADEGRCVVMNPGNDPVAALEHALGDEPALLVVDQLEEAFTLCPEEAPRARFLDALIDLSQSDTANVVAVLRADFYGRCADHPRLAAAVAAHQRLLGPMQTDELRRAIERPALAGGLRLEAGLVDGMLADVDGEPGALPLLSHALYESWIRRDGRVLTLAGYRAAGGVRGAIAHTADEVYEGCSPQEQALMRRMFLQLTELGESTEDTRRRVPLTELTPEDEGAEVGAVLEELAGSRLLVVGDGSAEIAHEALIREWPRLRGWLAEDRDELRTRRQLATAARSWDEGGRDDADLYRGARLDAALERVDEQRQLSPVEREFLDAGQASQERELATAQRRARRLRVLLAIVAGALVAAVIAGSFALIQRGSARRTATEAQAGRLAAQSREVAAQHPDLALLLALEAGNLVDSVDSRGALLAALERATWIRAWLQGFESPVVATAFNPSGTLLAATTIEGTTLYDTGSWKPVGEPLRSSQGGLSGVDFSPDGRTLAIAGGEGRVELWDVATRRELRNLTDPAAVAYGEPALSAVRYSPDGSVIAAGGLEANHVTLWSATTGRLLGGAITTNPPGSGAHSITFSPDSKRIAVPGVPGTVGIWDVATGHRVGKPVTIGTADVGDTIFADGGRTLIASDEAGAVSFVDLRSGRPTRPSLSVVGQVADSLDLSPDGRLLAVATFGGSIFIWNAKTGEPYGAPLAVDTSPVGAVVFSPDGKTLVSAHQRSAVVWDMSGEQALGKPLDGGIDLTVDMAFSPDGSRLVAGRYGGGVIAVDTATRRQTRLLDAGSIVTAVAFAPNGKRVAVGTIDGMVRLVDPTSGRAVDLPLDVPKAAVWQVAFSRDGRLLAVAVDPNGGGNRFYLQQRQGEVQLWDVASQKRVDRSIVPGAGSVVAVAFNPAGTLLATGSGGRLDLWDVATQEHHGRPMRVSDDGIQSVAFDPSGSLVAGGGAIGPARVWRVTDQRPAFPPLEGHTGYITGAAFDPSATFLATTTHFGATRLWDPATGLGYGDELVGSPRWLGPQAPSIDVPFLGMRNAFSPNGRLLAVSGVGTHGMLWEIDPAVWRERACAIAGRNLSREEWSLYLPEGTAFRATCLEWPLG
jgi:WD40 repeat protein/tRNA A-37 threonylcarbamoyl transferase component Bud32/energy-coupling factor transporter ATP-binding protein EcfA2